MTAQSLGYSRILVGASTFVDAKIALTLVGRMARNLRVCLGGLLVDDTVSTAICGSPNQHIILANGELAQVPTLAQIKTLIRADARAFRASLSRIADAAGTTWTFEQTGGDLVQSSLNMAPAWDIVVLGYRNIHPVDGKIVLISTGQPSDDRVVETWHWLCRDLSADRAVFMIHDSVRTDTEAAPKPPANGTFEFETLDDAIGKLARMNARVVVLDMARGPIRDPETLRELIEAARCPVFVFGPPAAAPRLDQTT